MKEKQGKVVIIGGGIHGRASAAELAPHYDVVLLEQYGPDHTRGASHGEDRLTRPTSGEGEIYGVMQKISVQRFSELAQNTGLEIFRNGNGFLAADMANRVNPHVWLFTNSELCDPQNPGQNSGYERMRGSDLNASDPYFNLSKDAVVIMQPGLRQIAATNAMTAFRLVAEQAGASLRFHTAVASIDFDHKHVKTADGEIIQADKIILATGSWVNKLLDHYQLPVVIEQHDVAYFPLLESLDTLPRPFCYEDANGIIYYGMFSEGCLKLGNHSHGGVILHPGEECCRPDKTGVKLLSSFVAEHMHHVSPHPQKIEAGKYTRTIDDHFLIGPHPNHPDVIVVSACSGHGFKHAPAVAMAVRAWIDGTPCGFDKSFFQLDGKGVDAPLTPTEKTINDRLADLARQNLSLK